MKNKSRVIVSTSKSAFNGHVLKRKRKERPYSKLSKFRRHMSKTQVGKKLGVSGGQICRYETDGDTKQIPKLKVFKKICILFQIDPKELLGLVWIDNELVDQDGMLYLDPEKEFVTEYRVCPCCKSIITDLTKSEEHYAKKANQIKIRKETKQKLDHRD